MLEWYLQTCRVPGLDATLLETESNRVETRFLNSAASWSGPARCQTHPCPPGRDTCGSRGCLSPDEKGLCKSSVSEARTDAQSGSDGLEAAAVGAEPGQLFRQLLPLPGSSHGNSTRTSWRCHAALSAPGPRSRLSDHVASVESPDLAACTEPSPVNLGTRFL